MAIKISICCCNYLFAEGIKKLIEGSEHNMDYVINTVNPEEEITAKADLIIADCHTLSKMFLEPLSKHKVGILLLLTSCPLRIQDQSLLGYISKGLIGVLPAEADVSQLMKAIKCVVSGELWFERKKLIDIFHYNTKNDITDSKTSLTIRETEIIKAVCKGYRNKEIMKHLNISEQTVKKHLNNIYKKLGVTDRLQLALYASRHWPLYISTT